MAVVTPPLFMDVASVYSGDELGLPYRDIISEGVVPLAGVLGTQLQVTQRGAGANMSVDVATGACWIKGDDDAQAQPTYRCRNNGATNLVITADPTNPRKVLIIAEIIDQTFAGASRLFQLRAVHGTPSGSPAEPALPVNAIPLALIDVTANDTDIVNGQITDRRVAAQIGGVIPVVNTRTARYPVKLTHSTDANAWWSVIALTDWQLGVWQMKRDVESKVQGHVLVPSNLAATPNAKLKLEIAANATTGNTRLQVGTNPPADGESLNPGALTDETAQDITVPGTAYLRKTVTFTLTNAPVANDILIVEVFHDGDHANDTLSTAETLLLGAWLEVDVT